MLILVSSALFANTIGAVQGADVSGVRLSVLHDPAPGAEFEVTLTVDGEPPLVVGIRETIPEGFGFVSTTCKNYEVSGQEIVFVVMDETVMSYRVTAPASGTGTFTGTWIDLLGEGEGSVAATTVAVGGSDTPSTSAQPGASIETPHADSEPTVPGFKALSLIGSLAIVLLLLIRMRVTGGRRK
ncbi:MAG: hypothetical protein ACP5E9_04425 [Candidatus Methanospirareceae archaeon]